MILHEVVFEAYLKYGGGGAVVKIAYWLRGYSVPVEYLSSVLNHLPLAKWYLKLFAANRNVSSLRILSLSLTQMPSISSCLAPCSLQPFLLPDLIFLFPFLSPYICARFSAYMLWFLAWCFVGLITVVMGCFQLFFCSREGCLSSYCVALHSLDMRACVKSYFILFCCVLLIFLGGLFFSEGKGE